MRGNQARYRQGRPRKGRGGGSNHPPSFEPTIVVHRKVRFQATAAKSADQLTAASFLDMLCTTPTAVSGTQIGVFVRIRSIEMWAPMPESLVPTSCYLEWNGLTPGMFGKSVRVSDTSMGANSVAHFKTSPPAGTQLAGWIGSGTQLIALMSYPINTVIDVTLDLVLRDDGTAVAVTGAVAGATVGATYTRALNSPVDNNLVPRSISTI